MLSQKLKQVAAVHSQSFRSVSDVAAVLRESRQQEAAQQRLDGALVRSCARSARS